MTVPPPQDRPAPASFPEPPQAVTIQLPVGATLTGVADLPASLGPDCHANFNLMLMLQPFLGNLECVFRLLKAVGWVLEFLPLVPQVANPAKIGEVIDKLGELPPITQDLLECVNSALPTGYCTFIKQLLLMITQFIGCMLDLLDSVVSQQLEIGLAMGDAQGNPELLAVLEQAQVNADLMGAQALRSCEPAFAILETVGSLLSALGAGAIELPSIDDLAGGEIQTAIQPIRDVNDLIGAVADALPC